MRRPQSVRATARRSLATTIVLLAMTGLGALDVPREARGLLFAAILSAALALVVLDSDPTPPPSAAAVVLAAA